VVKEALGIGGFVLQFSVVLTAVAWAAEVRCPASLSVDQKAAAAPAGWTVGYDKDRPSIVAGITFFDGPPDEQASLVYDSTVPGKAKWTAVWTFDPAPPKGIFLTCRYAGTTATLSRRLPAGTRECRVVFNKAVKVDGFDQVESIACKP
jgi:hypothetical protein